MIKYYSKGNSRTRVLTISENNHTYNVEQNSLELSEKLKEMNFKKVTKRLIESKAMECYYKEIEQDTKHKLSALDLLNQLDKTI